VNGPKEAFVLATSSRAVAEEADIRVASRLVLFGPFSSGIAHRYGLLPRVENPRNLFGGNSLIFIFRPRPDQRKQPIDWIIGFNAIEYHVPTVAFGVVLVLGANRLCRSYGRGISLPRHRIGEVVLLIRTGLRLS
jgi:hypothetical protein